MYVYGGCSKAREVTGTVGREPSSALGSAEREGRARKWADLERRVQRREEREICKGEGEMYEATLGDQRAPSGREVSGREKA